VAEADVVYSFVVTQMFILFYIPGSYADLHDQGGKSTAWHVFPFVVMILKSVPGFCCNPVFSWLNLYVCLSSSTIKPVPFWFTAKRSRLYIPRFKVPAFSHVLGIPTCMTDGFL
jgi:hypothetical protein